jgi:glycosyltransferase involved in cell wall biosynthesis
VISNSYIGFERSIVYSRFSGQAGYEEFVVEERHSLNVEPGAELTPRQPSAAVYDVFVDLSDCGLKQQQLSEHLEAILYGAGLSGAARWVTALVPKDLIAPARAANLSLIHVGASNASDLLHRALRAAAQHDCHLVVVLNALLPANEVIYRLIEEFERDPLFGTAQPRFADASNDRIWPLPYTSGSMDKPATLTRAGLGYLPDRVITPELLSACTVVRREVVREMERGRHHLALAGELRRLLSQARKCGFRNVVVNRTVIASSLSYAALYPSLPKNDAEQLKAMYPELVRADAWCASPSQLGLETVLAGFYADGSGNAHRLLLDCRGMTSTHNGTSHAVLGLLDGFQALDCCWQIEAVASSSVIDFFKLKKRYRKFGWIADRPSDSYAAAILLNQPWALSTIAELHRHALLIAFNMLDTTSWDILYPCDERLDAVWRFMARYSDVLFYDSQFTRDRVAIRFPPQPHVTQQVTYLSLAKDEQINPNIAGEASGDHILLFGNEYEHKDIRRTLQLLADAFPYARIVAIGIDGPGLRNVTTMPSGTIEHTVLHRLMATARVIVFPSFYEGFGIPVVQGLAYGRTVIARQSPLWEEIAAHVRMPGQLVQFDSAVALVEAVGRALAGHPLRTLPQGTALATGQSPLRWQDCAQQMIDTLEKLLPSADAKRWLERDEALRAIDRLHTNV